MVIVGEKEEENETISIRKQSEGDLGTFSLKEFVTIINKETNSTLEQF